MVVELYKKAKSLTYELAWEIAWKKTKNRLKRSCETAKGKCDTQSEEEKKKKRKNRGINERLNIVLVLDLLLASLQRSHLIISHCLFFSPLFTLSRLFSFTFSRPGYFAAGSNHSLAFSFTPVPFVSISLVHPLPLSFLFILFYFFLFQPLILPFMFRIHIFACPKCQLAI